MTIQNGAELKKSRMRFMSAFNPNVDGPMSCQGDDSL